MSERIHALAHLLLGKASLEECTLEELQHLTKRFPYYAPAQFLLQQKLQQSGSPEAGKQKQKALLYYPDPLQFETFIAPQNFIVDESIFTTSDVALPNETVGATGNEVLDSVLTEEESLLQQDAITATEEAPVGVPLTGTITAEESIEEASAPGTTEEAEPFFVEDLKQEETASETDPKESAVEESYIPVEPAPLETPPAETEQPGPEQEAEPDETTVEDETPVEETTESSTPPAPDFSNLRNLIDGSKPEGDEPALTFEPFHTVDYFASQGIKISADELPKDRLGKQLRSFTEWLKVMKRLPATEQTQTPESYAERNVESLASHSIVQSDVVTEAMAEVWTKQGNRQKAIETYNKLSLLNPSKKAYFAAKIENLKAS